MHASLAGDLTPDSARAKTAAMLIYKIFREQEWQDFSASGETEGAPVDVRAGFIHFSTAEQLLETANRHFAGENGLTILAIEDDGLGRALRWEPSRGGQLFPHLYRPLSLKEVVWARPMEEGPDGHVLPDGVA